MKIVQCTQGKTDWHQARCGKPTASEFDSLVTPLWKARTGDGPENYLLKKIAESVMGHPIETFFGGAVEQGTLLEDEAIPFYQGVYGVEVERVGFCTTDDGRIGASPDGLIGDDNGLEVKCPEPHTHVKYLLGGIVPKDYVQQVQGAMYVTGRPRWTFLSYSRWFPPLIVHVERDPIAQAALDEALTTFLAKFDAGMVKINGLIQMKGRAS